MRRMRLVRIAAVALLAGICGGDSSTAEQPAHWWDAARFSLPKGAKRVTVVRDGATIATITVPDGVIVSIYSSDRPAPHGPKETYHGRSEIRLRSGTGIPPMTDMEAAMARAPVVIAVAISDVTLETLSR